MKWVYPAAASDAEFLTRATLASTLFIDEFDATCLRRLLNAFGKNLHLKKSKSLGPRNLLQRATLVAELVARFVPKRRDIPNLVKWAETGVGAAEADLQVELTQAYTELHHQFSPLAFLYELRLHGGLAHSPSRQSAATAAKKLGLAEKGWRRTDYLQLLHRVHYAVEAVVLRLEAAANALATCTKPSSGTGPSTTTERTATPMKKTKTASKEEKGGASPSHLIDARIAALGDWRGEMLARVRKLIRQADPEVMETWKWRGVPVWEHAGIICTGETYKAVVKLTFAKGAALEDPSGLFNASLEGNVRRAIDIHEGDKINEKALKALIRAAVALNVDGR